MTKSKYTKTAIDAMERPKAATPRIDRPWDDAAALERRLKTRSGDRSAHRMYHSLFEDMLD